MPDDIESKIDAEMEAEGMDPGLFTTGDQETLTDQLAAALGQMGVSPAALDPTLANLPAWTNERGQRSNRNAYAAALGPALAAGFDPDFLGGRFPKKMAALQERMDKAGLAPSSQQYIMDRVKLEVGHAPTGEKLDEAIEQFASDSALTNFADMDEASRTISRAISEGESRIDQDRRDWRTQQAAAQRTIAPRVSQWVARGSGEGSAAGDLAEGLRLRELAQQPDWRQQRRDLRSQILEDPTVLAVRQAMADSDSTRRDDLSAAAAAYRELAPKRTAPSRTFQKGPAGVPQMGAPAPWEIIQNQLLGGQRVSSEPTPDPTMLDFPDELRRAQSNPSTHQLRAPSGSGPSLWDAATQMVSRIPVDPATVSSPYIPSRRPAMSSPYIPTPTSPAGLGPIVPTQGDQAFVAPGDQTTYLPAATPGYVLGNTVGRQLRNRDARNRATFHGPLPPVVVGGG